MSSSPTRRQLLIAGASTASVLLAGCSALGDSSQEQPVSATSTNISADGSRCTTEGAAQHRATVSYAQESSQLTIDGTIATHRPCLELYVGTQNGVGKADAPSSALFVDIDIPWAGDCERCPAEIDYTATIAVSGAPSTVAVSHVEKQDDSWVSVGPVTTTEI
jgi:hypothetical protein